MKKHHAGRGAAILALTFLAACGGAQTPNLLVEPAPAPTSSTATKNGVTVKVTLSSTQAQAGDIIAGTVTITNNTNTNITEPAACKDSVLAVALSDGKLTTAWAWSAVGCNNAFALTPGTTTLPVSVTTTYDGKTGLSPLPPGRYQAKLYLNRFPLPVPSVIPVAITK